MPAFNFKRRYIMSSKYVVLKQTGESIVVAANSGVEAVHKFIDNIRGLGVGSAYIIQKITNPKDVVDAKMLFKVSALGDTTKFTVYQAILNRNEPKNCDVSALHQNWFCNKRMRLINEYYSTQTFYDMDTRCIYVVQEEPSGVGIAIHEISPSNPSYATYFNEIL